MKIFKGVLFIILYLVIYYFFQILFMIFGVAFVKVLETVSTQGLNSTKAMGNALITSIIISGTISFFIYWGISYLRKQKFFEICNFKKVKFHYLIIALILGFTLNSINEYLLLQLLKFDIFKDALTKFMFMSEMITSTNTIIAILGVGIVGPIIEEVIFRGLIFKELEKMMPISLVIVVQGILFGIYHLNLVQFIYTTLIGILLGVAYILTKSLWVPIFIHIVNNISALFISEDQRIINFPFFIISIIITGVCYMYFYKKREKDDKKVNENSV